jgi:hypothetical protein
MRSRSWKRLACAACLLLTVAGAYRASAVPLRGRAAPPAAREAILHGRRLVTFGGYELNISFTAAGRLVCLDISGASG